jgi:GntR family transcriptional regulator
MQPGLSKRPLYLQLRDALTERIASGKLKPGQLLPNETELAQEFGVSPGTMRKALDLMESERVITRKQGRGTFVNDQASDELVDRYCNIRGAHGERIAGRMTTLAIAEAVADERECRQLGLQGQDRVWRLRRVRFHGDQAFMHEEASLPAAMFPRLDQRSHDRIVVLAQQFGVLLGPAEERISIGAASYAAAQALGIATNAPVFVLDRIVRDIDGRPVEWRRGECLPGDLRYSARLV